MDQEERIKALKGRLEAEETKIKGLLMAGKVPVPEDYTETDRLKRDLKTVRRIMAMAKNRTAQKLTRSYNLTFSEQEFNELAERAEKRGVKLSSYVRNLIKSGLKVEDDAP